MRALKGIMPICHESRKKETHNFMTVPYLQPLFLLTFDGYPTSPSNFAHGQRCSLEAQETPVIGHLENLAR